MSTTKIFLSLLLLLVAVFAEEYKVAIFDYDVRPANEETVAKYIEKKLRESGLDFNEIKQTTGKEDQKISWSVLSELENGGYNLIITITSDAYSPASFTLKKTPWLFTNINNPTFFGIANSNNPGGNKSGVTYYVPALKQLELYRQILNGKMSKVGIIFDEAAKVRIPELREFRDAAQKLGITLDVKVVKEKSDLPIVAKELTTSGAEAIIVTSSDLLYKNVNSMLSITTPKGIPIFSVNKKGVSEGAVAAFSSDYFSMVDECLIPMALDVLKHKKSPGEMPIRSLAKPGIYLNETQAKKLGLTIPGDIQGRAAKTF